MRLVVDSNVVVAVCLAGGELGPLASHDLHAPALLASEVASALRELAFRRQIPEVRGGEALSHLAELGITYAPAASQVVAALTLAERLGWAKTYDAEYVVLARALGCPLVTADARLARGAAGEVETLAPLELGR